MIDKLIKFRWWKVQLNNCLTYMLREKNVNLTKNDWNMNFQKYNLNVVIQSIITICWLRFLS
jgi:hypothetical protein